jgi:RNA polymerase-binding transcription factor DksA
MKTMPPLSGPDRLTQDAGPYGIAGTSTPLKKYAEQLARIESALARMEAGNYGLCTGCDGRIPLTRLRADPAIATCADCKEPKYLTV